MKLRYLLMSILPVTAVAVSDSSPLLPQNEFRFGLGLGVDYGIMTADSREDHSVITSAGHAKRPLKDKQFQFSPAVEGGYFFECFYLGAVGSWHSGELKDRTSSFLGSSKYINTSFKAGNDFKLALKAGPTLRQAVLPYILVGMSLNSYKSKVDFVDFAGGNSFVSASNSKSGYQLHPDLGLGIEVPVTENVSCSLQYVHTFKQTIKNSQHVSTSFSHFMGGGMDDLIIPRSGNISNKVKYAKDTVTFRVSMFF